MMSCKVNWDKVKELGIEITPRKPNLKKTNIKKPTYKRNESNYRYKWCDGQLLRYNIKTGTYT
tara:strand:- start:200 stop:388 length:189 start_codon:yes stop_codon:yes gene_type:complete